MKQFYKIKRCCHLFINNIFYFVVFLVGLFIGLFGREFLKIENVFAVELPIYEDINIDYENLPIIYKNRQYIEKLDRIKEYFYKKYDKEEYGITIALLLRLDETYENIMPWQGRDSKIYVFAYKKSDMTENAFSFQTQKDSFYYYNFKVIFGSGIHFVYKVESIGNTGLFSTTPLNEFDTWISNVYDTLFEGLDSTGSGSGYYSPFEEFTPRMSFLVYHSDFDLKVTSGNYLYKMNNELIGQGDIVPTYTNWKKNQKQSVLDNMTYTCTSLPFFLSEKVGTLSDHKNYETFSSQIYFDYDIPYDLYPYLFDFYNYNIPNNYKNELSGYPRFLQNGLINGMNHIMGNLSSLDSDDLLYQVPFTINVKKSTYFLGSSRLLEMKIRYDEDNNKVVAWDTLKNLSNYTIDYKTNYFYDFLRYKELLPEDMPYSVYKNHYSRHGVNEIVKNPYVNLDSIMIKADYVEYLLTVRSNRDVLEGMCFYYDNNNLTFSFATFDDNGNITGTLIDKGSLTEVTVDINYDVWGNSQGEFVLDNSLKSPLAYLGKLVEIVWNVFPNGLKIVFISVFTITLIFMFLRMVGWYG